MKAHRILLAMFGLALVAGCNDDASRDVCDGGTTLARDGGDGCAFAHLITETGFLCPEEIPAAWEFGNDYVLCLPEGDTPGAVDERTLCDVLADEGYSWDVDAGVCVAPDGDAVQLEPLPGDAGDAGGPDAGEDAGSPDVDDDTVTPDAGPDDTGPIDAGQPDFGFDGGSPDTAADTTPVDAGTDAGAISCANNGDPCPDGMQCVQTAPPFCSTDYIGVCEPIDSEATCPAVPVCGCDGQEWGDACQAREAGYTEIFVPCDDACPDVADSCEEGCFEMRAFPYNEAGGCVDYTAGALTVGCTSMDGGTDDTPCVKRASDGAVFVATSGSAFVASEAWIDCTPAEQEAVQSGCD